MTPSRSGHPAPIAYRSLFLSDLHLGARANRPDLVVDFLRGIEAETLYLVGDIFDLAHGARLHWGERQEAVMQELRRHRARGTRVIYLPGNHDADMRAPGAKVEDWDLREALIHRAADGRKYLVLHGDQCDPRLLRLHAMTRLGSRLDGMLRRLDGWMQSWMADDRPSPARRVIRWANRQMAMGDRFERRLTALARAAGASGVICGHSHMAALRTLDGITFANCGDWVDSLTALAEDRAGQLRLVEYSASASSERARPPSGLRAPKDGTLAGGLA